MKKQTIFLLIGISLAVAAIGYFLYKKYKKPGTVPAIPGRPVDSNGTPITASPAQYAPGTNGTNGATQVTPPPSGAITSPTTVGSVIGAVNNLLSPNPTPSAIVAAMPTNTGANNVSALAFSPALPQLPSQNVMPSAPASSTARTVPTKKVLIDPSLLYANTQPAFGAFLSNL